MWEKCGNVLLCVKLLFWYIVIIGLKIKINFLEMLFVILGVIYIDCKLCYYEKNVLLWELWCVLGVWIILDFVEIG